MNFSMGWKSAAIFVFAILTVPANAQTDASAYPQQPIRFIVPLSPGGVADIMARIVAERLQAKLGQPVVVENKPGAGTTLGMAFVAKAKADGYTIGLGNIAANAIAPALNPSIVPYEPVNDFAPISMIGFTPSLLVVNTNKISAKSIPELIAYLKQNPGKVSFGSSGVGSSLHVGMELFMLKTGTSMVHVPYKGSAPMLADLLSGEVQVALDSWSTSGPHVESGKLRALGVTTVERAFFAPQVPTIAEFVPGFEVKAWHGVMAPAGTPAPIVAKLSAEIRDILRQPEVVSKLRERGVITAGSTPVEFKATMQEQFEAYKAVIKQAGIKPE